MPCGTSQVRVWAIRLYHQELYKIAIFCLCILHKDEQVCVWKGRKASYHKNSFGNVSTTYYYDIRDCSNLHLLMRGKCVSFLPAVLGSLLLLIIPSCQMTPHYCFYHVNLICLSYFHNMIVISISYHISFIIIVCFPYPFVFFPTFLISLVLQIVQYSIHIFLQTW